MAIEKRTGKDGKPRYRVRIAERDPVTGKRRNVTIGTYRTKREAEAEERDATLKRDRGTLLDPDTTTVAELLTDWLRVKGGEISPQTGVDYETTIRLHLVPALGGVRIRKLTTDAVQAQYDAWAAEGKSARMVRGCHLRLRQALDWAVSRGLLYVNVAQRATPPRLPKSDFDVWDRDELARFIDAAMHRPVLVRMSAKRGATSRPASYRPDPLTPLWHLLALEGMRRGEALGLRWRDINWDRGTAHIWQTVAPDKTNRGRAVIQPYGKTARASRTVRLTRATLEVLREHRKQQAARRLAASEWEDNDLIVCTDHGTPVNPGGNITRSFDRIVKRAGLRRIRVHDLRHTHATLLLLAGVPVKIVSERLGHASTAFTMDVYASVLPDMQAVAAGAADDLLLPPVDSAGDGEAAATMDDLLTTAAEA